MNIQIFNLSNSDKLKNIDKNLSIPSVLYYQSSDTNKHLNDIITNFRCNKNNCCIDKNIYNSLIENVKPNKKEHNNYNKQMTKRRNKKYNSTRKTSKKVISTK